MSRPWALQPGAQSAFAATPADVAIFSGPPGSGKSFALLYEAAKWAHVAGCNAVLFRRTFPELAGAGGLWDASQGLYRDLGGLPRASPHLDWTFGGGAHVEFRHLGREADALSHRGRDYAFVGFDDLPSFTEQQFWLLVSRLRSPSRVRPYLRATCDRPEKFVGELFGWWIDSEGHPIAERSGVLRWLVRDGDARRWFDSTGAAESAFPGTEPLSLTLVAQNTRGKS